MAAHPHSSSESRSPLAAQLEWTARLILDEFDRYYVESRGIPAKAQRAFEARDHPASIALSRRRLSLYSESIGALVARVRAECPPVVENEGLWQDVERRYLPRIAGRYEADLAFAYLHSVRRVLYRDEWKPVAYSFHGSAPAAGDPRVVCRRFELEGGDEAAVGRVLDIPGFSVPYRDAGDDARLVAARLAEVRRRHAARGQAVDAIEMIDAGFFRNRGGYLVGRLVGGQRVAAPFVVALLNSPRGIYVDALIDEEADAHNLFSSTLANFHVTNPHYHELSAFLHSLMPKRPLGLHYSTIGFNHVGKVAVMSELERELVASDEVLETAVGFRGTVAIAFSAPSSDYNLKVIRDRPTAQYKWGRFAGVESVLGKYRKVHEINRTGSMLDNIIYQNLKLERSWFDGELLEELLRDASESVSLRGDAVVFRYLIVQRRVTPLPVFLEQAPAEDARAAIVNLGDCIKNNAAANIFNKDLDARNYGVSRFLKVYLYDYDALEPLTEVEIHSNRDRVEGEEDVPDWVYADGVVFLPEEVDIGLRLPGRALLELFREVHGDLLTPEYWRSLQAQLRAGWVPGIRVYPERCRLRRGEPAA